jgi:putative methionine-R-sulfoxide reductase with GAF domain
MHQKGHMNEINPVEFGKMKEQIEHLQKGQDELNKDMKSMLALANQSKGGFWMGMAIASFIGSMVTIFLKNWIH